MFTLQITTENEAFADEDDARLEVARILETAALRLVDGTDGMTLHDINGNSVGSFLYDRKNLAEIEIVVVRDDDAGATFTPWMADGAVGLRVTFDDDRPPRYVYLNPSSGSDDAVANVFVYYGTTGRPLEDVPVHHYDITDDELADHA